MVERLNEKILLLSGAVLWGDYHETIYAAIYPQLRGALKQGMIQSLRQAKPKRGVRRTTAAAHSFVPENQRIAYRPQDIEQRLILGHERGDFIKGPTTGRRLACWLSARRALSCRAKMDGCTSDDALVGFTRQMKKLPAFLRQSMTY